MKKKVGITCLGEQIELKRKRLLERLSAEMDFAEFICGKSRGSKDWKELSKRARKRAEERLLGGSIDLEKIISEIEDILSPVAAEAKKYTVYCIGHAHIDMNWMWSWPETVAVTNDTFKTVLDLLEEFPQFCFSQGQASIYKIVEQFNPSMLDKIRKFVEEGRWELTASHWVENEANIISGEAMCRHLLYTRRYMKKLFGVEPEDIPVNWAPDTFGFAATLPSILREGAVKYMYLHRPGASGAKRPRAFYWKAADGADVLVKNDMHVGYNCVLSPLVATDYLVNFSKETGLNFVNVVYGVGDHGGGPTRRDLNYALEMDRWKIFPSIKFSTAREFFERLDSEGKNLPEFKGELNFEFTGCYTSQSLIKKIARYGERKLLDTEQQSLFSSLISGKKADKAQMETNWRNILFSHFHDILPGSGVHDTRTHTHGLYQEAMASAGIISTESLRLIAENVDTMTDLDASERILPDLILPLASGAGAGAGFGTENGGTSLAERGGGEVKIFLVFNTSANRRKEVLEFVVWNNSSWNNINKDKLKYLKFSAFSPDGKKIQCQTIDSGQYWGHDFVKIAFPVDLPPNGYSVYSVAEDDFSAQEEKTAFLTGFKHHCPYAFYERSPEGIENEFIKLEIDPVTGWIKNLIDKKTGKVFSSNRDCPLLEYSVERGRQMTAWETEHAGRIISPELRLLKRLYDGPHKAAARLTFSIKESEVNLTYELRAGDPKLYINLDVFWFQKGSLETGVPRLDFALPVFLQNPVSEYEIPFSVIERNMKHGEEVPALRWAKVKGKINGSRSNAGLMLINDSKNGYSFKDGVLRLSLIRSSYDPDPLPEAGRHQIRLALHPFSEELSHSEAIRAGIDFNHQPEIVSTGIHSGKLPKTLSFIKIDGDAAVLSAIKFSEESNKKIILRLFNPENKDTMLSFKISEFAGELKKLSPSDLIERLTDDASVKINGNSAKIKLAANSISSFIAELL